MTTGAAQLTPERAARNTFPVCADIVSLYVTGRRLAGRYLPLRSLSARGNVWLAEDESGRGFALKSGPRPLLEHEARVLARISHPHVVRLVEVIALDDAPILVLEYLSGGDLVSLAGLDPDHWLEAAAAVVQALTCVRACGFVHRDLKARNVMFDGAGMARLIDFGSAVRRGGPWSNGGTTAEAVRPGRDDRPAGTGDDTYALAALLHELLYGAPPGQQSGRPGSAPVLEALVSATLAAPASRRRPELKRYASVIESLLEQRSAKP
jgi:serine/threonine protein kinase